MLQTLRLSGPDKRGAELELWRDNVFQVVIFWAECHPRHRISSTCNYSKSAPLRVFPLVPLCQGHRTKNGWIIFTMIYSFFYLIFTFLRKRFRSFAAVVAATCMSVYWVSLLYLFACLTVITCESCSTVAGTVCSSNLISVSTPTKITLVFPNMKRDLCVCVFYWYIYTSGDTFLAKYCRCGRTLSLWGHSEGY